ncbi:MAG: hypothetical protein JRM80_10805, partial [Nitrososphaerota archaeon]|nr:hypothetical protein [Nitrososphaerota archaeon]
MSFERLLDQAGSFKRLFAMAKKGGAVAPWTPSQGRSRTSAMEVLASAMEGRFIFSTPTATATAAPSRAASSPARGTAGSASRWPGRPSTRGGSPGAARARAPTWGTS